VLEAALKAEEILVLLVSVVVLLDKNADFNALEGLSGGQISLLLRGLSVVLVSTESAELSRRPV
jgi:hypothetical protein